MRTGERVASRARNSPLRKKAPALAQGVFFALMARVSGFLRPDAQRQRPGVFRASGSVLCVRIKGSEGDHLRLVLLDSLVPGLYSVPQPPSEAESRADHVGI